MLQIGFLTTIGINVGDEFIRNGIRAILDSLEIDYAPLYVNKHDPHSLTVPCEDEHLQVGDKFFESDLFIQAGAPVYWNLPGGSSSVQSDWYRWIWKERILSTSLDNGPVFANLGAGSCQPWGEEAETFLDNPACAQFAKDAAERASLTTVRDPLAKEILDHLQCKSEAIACPAFFAAKRYAKVLTRPSVIGVNLMPFGSHFDFHGDFPTTSWKQTAHQLVEGLRKLGTPWFIAHDQKEADFMEAFRNPGESIFLASSWRDYLDAYGACGLVVANRVHGAVLSAGFGIPAIIIGNDSRAQIGDFMEIPRFRSGETSSEEILTHASSLFSHSSNERERLLALREETFTRYAELLKPIVDLAYHSQASRMKKSRPLAQPSTSEESRISHSKQARIDFKAGWYERESDGNAWWQWMERWAEMELWIPEAGNYEIVADILPAGEGAILWQSEWGTSGSFPIQTGDFAPIPSWSLSLPEGITRLRIFWSGPTGTPKNDTRVLGCAWRNASLKKIQPPTT